jgi:hypothetical protein
MEIAAGLEAGICGLKARHADFFTTRPNRDRDGNDDQRGEAEGSRIPPGRRIRADRTRHSHAALHSTTKPRNGLTADVAVALGAE